MPQSYKMIPPHPRLMLFVLPCILYTYQLMIAQQAGHYNLGRMFIQSLH